MIAMTMTTVAAINSAGNACAPPIVAKRT